MLLNVSDEILSLNEGDYANLMRNLLSKADTISLHITDIYQFFAFCPSAESALLSEYPSYDDNVIYEFLATDELKEFVLISDPSRNRVKVGDCIVDDLELCRGNEECIISCVTHERMYHADAAWRDYILSYVQNGRFYI